MTCGSWETTCSKRSSAQIRVYLDNKCFQNLFPVTLAHIKATTQHGESDSLTICRRVDWDRASTPKKFPNAAFLMNFCQKMRSITWKVYEFDYDRTMIRIIKYYGHIRVPCQILTFLTVRRLCFTLTLSSVDFREISSNTLSSFIQKQILIKHI